MTYKIAEYELEMVVELLQILGKWTEIAYLKPLPRDQTAKKAWELWEIMHHYSLIIWDKFENEFLDYCMKSKAAKKEKRP
jgi:hypothetical protein